MSPKKVGDDVIEFEKVIFERGKYFTLEMLVLHSKDILPDVTAIGKIAGIDKIQIEKTWETKMRPSFLKDFFHGDFLINFLRLIAAAIVWIILIVAIVVSSETLSSRKNKFKRKKRQKEIEVLFDKTTGDEKTQFIIESYTNEGLAGLKEIEAFLKDKNRLLLEIKQHTIEEEYKAKLKALLPEKSKDVMLNEEAMFLHEREYVSAHGFRYLWHRPPLGGLLKKKIVELANQETVTVDADFEKSLLQTIKYFEDKANKKIQQTRD